MIDYLAVIGRGSVCVSINNGNRPFVYEVTPATKVFFVENQIIQPLVLEVISTIINFIGVNSESWNSRFYKR